MVAQNEVDLWVDEIPTAPIYWITRQAVAARRLLHAVEAARVCRSEVRQLELDAALDALATADADLMRHQEICSEHEALTDEHYAEVCHDAEVSA